MTRTRRASVVDPKKTTSDSRDQRKNTNVAKQDSASPLRATRSRSKKTGRLERVDHEFIEAELGSPRDVRPKITTVHVTTVHVPPPEAVKISERQETNDKSYFTFQGSVSERTKEKHHTLPRTTKQPTTAIKTPATPAVAAPRAAAAIATASAAHQVEKTPSAIRVRAAGEFTGVFPGA